MQWMERLGRDARRQAQPFSTETSANSSPVAAPSFGRRLRMVALGSVKEWSEQRAASKGAALAFYTLFSMAPMLVLVIAIAGSVFGTKAAQGELFNQLNSLIGPTGASALQALVASARNPDQGRIATVIATLILVAGATTAFAELKESLDEIWHVPKTHRSGLVDTLRTRLLSFGLVLTLAFVLLVSLVINAGLAIVERYWQELWMRIPLLSLLGPVLGWFAALLSFSAIACMFAVIYKMLPQIRLSWRDVWIGAFGTAALFTLGKYLIGLYLSNSGVTNSFGAAGSLVALLLWVYYSAQIFFLGAEFTRQYALWFGSLRSWNEQMASPR